jgi:protein-tyrosine phosphatase
MYIDFHTHILPDMDDGARDTHESLTMLSCAEQCGAETVVFTPHVSSEADFKEFIKKRKMRADGLKRAIKKEWFPCPEVLLGAEVSLDGSLAERKGVSALCVEGTDLLLLELPYTSWNSWYNNEIYNLISKHNVTPVMAHIERYLKSPKDIAKLSSLVSFGVKFQVNAGSFMSFRGRKIIRALAAEGLISFIGSDCHNMSGRSPDITKAIRAFKRKFGDEFVDYLYNKSADILESHKIK